MLRALVETPVELVVAALVFFVASVTILLTGLAKTEFGPAARRRRNLRQAAARAQRARSTAGSVDARGSGATEGARGDSDAAHHSSNAVTGRITAAEAQRLAPLRARAAYIEHHPTRPRPFWLRVRILWRSGYAGWIAAILIGSFSMATHFGAYWLIAGGGWLGAIGITLLSTGMMVFIGGWIGLGLVDSR